MNKISDEQREALDKMLAANAEATDAITDAMEPFKVALEALGAVHFAIEEQFGVETRGHCEFCTRLLIVGDLVHRGDDGDLCEDCAPTYADVMRQYEEIVAAGDDGQDPERYQEIVADLEQLRARPPEELNRKNIHALD